MLVYFAHKPIRKDQEVHEKKKLHANKTKRKKYSYCLFLTQIIELV